MSRTRVVSYWLMPTPKDAKRFQAVIDKLTDETRTISFAPHLTLGSLDDRTEDVTKVMNTTGAFALEPIQVDGSNVFTTSLFVRFQITQPILAMRSKFEAMEDFRPGRAFDPHISLHYGEPPEGAASRSFVLDLLERPVTFDRLRAVSVELPITQSEDLKSWQVFDEFCLSGG